MPIETKVRCNYDTEQSNMVTRPYDIGAEFLYLSVFALLQYHVHGMLFYLSYFLVCYICWCINERMNMILYIAARTITSTTSDPTNGKCLLTNGNQAVRNCFISSSNEAAELM